MKTFIAVCILTYTAGICSAFANPSISDARPLLEELGRSLADFQKCSPEDVWGKVSDARFDFVEACKRSDTDGNIMEKISRSAARDRRAEIDSSGFTCKGDIQERVDALVTLIQNAIKQNCNGNR